MSFRTDVIGIKLNNTQRIASSNVQDTMNRLSTGLRINSAKDDSAGLQISTRLQSLSNEKIKVVQNLKDETNFMKTKESVLSQVSSMAARIKELSIQANNGTYGESDIKTIKDEITTIISEMNRLSQESTFNGIKLFKNGAMFNGDNGLSFQDHPGMDFADGDFVIHLEFSFKGNGTSAYEQLYSKRVTGIPSLEIQISSQTNLTVGGGGGMSQITPISKETPYKYTIMRKDGETVYYLNEEVIGRASIPTSFDTDQKLSIGMEYSGSERFNGIISNFQIFKNSLDEKDLNRLWNGMNTAENPFFKALSETVPDNTVFTDESTNKFAGTSLKNLQEVGIADTYYLNADNALEKIDGFINYVSSERSKLGAMINRNEYKISNLDTEYINARAAMSRIKETDMAETTSGMVKEELKIQTSMQMLQKNNTKRENMLTLLQG